MPGSALTCIWHAAYVKDGAEKSTGLKQPVLKSVTSYVAGLVGAVFSPIEFDSVIPPEKTPSFDTFSSYFRRQLTAGIMGAKFEELMANVEKTCWSMCVMSYQPRMLYFEEDKENLWQVFNRLTEEGSYPPVAHEAEVAWLISRVASSLNVAQKNIDQFPEGGMTFQALLTFLESTYFTSLSLTTKIHEAITEMRGYCVLQILRTGWMHKRTRKQSNWTNWQHRYFVHEPGKLTYYENEQRSVKKGEVLIDANTRVEAQDNFKTLMKNLSGRFKVTISAAFEIEMAAGDENERRLWMTSIQENVLAARDNVTPFQQQLRDRRRKITAAPKATAAITPPTSGRSTPTMTQQTNINSASPGTPPQQKKATNGFPTGERKQSGPFLAVVPKSTVHPAAEEEFDNNVDYEQKKIEAIFLKIDKDGNGKIDRSEFAEFLRRGLHLTMSDSEIDLVFNTLDKKKQGSVGFNDFYEYFIKFVLDEDLTGAESQMRTAFLQADRNGTGTIDFREFSDFVWTRRQTMTSKKVAELFDQMDLQKTGEISYNDFRSFVKRQGTMKNLALPSTDATGGNSQSLTNVDHFEALLKTMYNESDVGEIVTYLRNRWEKFASFKRFGGAGELVMTGGSGMVADVLPGEYTLLDLACFNDLPPIIPHHIEIKGIQWITSNVPGVSGKLLFPESFNGVLPVEIATNEHLAYYGCSLADSSQIKVALLYRHGIQDFTYQNNYLEEYVKDESKMGGGGLEHHEFAHLDCPLEDNSGYFVIGKLVNKTELHLTGFKVPTRHTLYLPGGIIHCNDYLKGTWRTMLSDEADIDHVQIVRSRRKGAITEMEHFIFSFQS